MAVEIPQEEEIFGGKTDGEKKLVLLFVEEEQIVESGPPKPMQRSRPTLAYKQSVLLLPTS